MSREGKMDSRSLEKRLSAVRETNDDIQTLSRWCIQHKNHQHSIIQAWSRAVRKSKVHHRLTLFYVCNDIVQNCRRKKISDLVQHFATAIKEAAPLVRDEKIRTKIIRIFNIWEERGVYDAKFISDLTEIVQNVGTVNASENEIVLSSFQPIQLVEGIRGVVALEKTTESLLTDYKNQDFPLTDEEINNLRQTVKERGTSRERMEEFEEAVIALECYMASVQKEVEERTQVVTLLEQAEIFYETQRGEAKMVANAYKNFGNRVKSLKSKLAEKLKTLPPPTPIGTPEIDAPSPENSDEEDLSLPESGTPGLVSFLNSTKFADFAKDAFGGKISDLDSRLAALREGKGSPGKSSPGKSPPLRSPRTPTVSPKSPAGRKYTDVWDTDDAQDSFENQETWKSREDRNDRDSWETRSSRDIDERRDTREMWNSRSSRDRDSVDRRDYTSVRELRNSRGSRDSRDSHDDIAEPRELYRSSSRDRGMSERDYSRKSRERDYCTTPTSSYDSPIQPPKLLNDLKPMSAAELLDTFGKAYLNRSSGGGGSSSSSVTSPVGSAFEPSKPPSTSAPTSSIHDLFHQPATTTAPSSSIHDLFRQPPITTTPSSSIHDLFRQPPATTTPSVSIRDLFRQPPTTTTPVSSVHDLFNQPLTTTAPSSSVHDMFRPPPSLSIPLPPTNPLPVPPPNPLPVPPPNPMPTLPPLSAPPSTPVPAPSINPLPVPVPPVIPPRTTDSAPFVPLPVTAPPSYTPKPLYPPAFPPSSDSSPKTTYPPPTQSDQPPYRAYDSPMWVPPPPPPPPPPAVLDDVGESGGTEYDINRSFSQGWSDYDQYSNPSDVNDEETDDRNWGEPPGNEELQALNTDTPSSPPTFEKGFGTLLPPPLPPAFCVPLRSNLRELATDEALDSDHRNLVSIQPKSTDSDYRCYDYSVLSDQSEKSKGEPIPSIQSLFSSDDDVDLRLKKPGIKQINSDSGSDMDISISNSEDDMDISDESVKEEYSTRRATDLGKETKAKEASKTVPSENRNKEGKAKSESTPSKTSVSSTKTSADGVHLNVTKSAKDSSRSRIGVVAPTNTFSTVSGKASTHTGNVAKSTTENTRTTSKPPIRFGNISKSAIGSTHSPVRVVAPTSTAPMYTGNVTKSGTNSTQSPISVVAPTNTCSSVKAPTYTGNNVTKNATNSTQSPISVVAPTNTFTPVSVKAPTDVGTATRSGQDGTQSPIRVVGPTNKAASLTENVTKSATDSTHSPISVLTPTNTYSPASIQTATHTVNVTKTPTDSTQSPISVIAPTNTYSPISVKPPTYSSAPISVISGITNTSSSGFNADKFNEVLEKVDVNAILSVISSTGIVNTEAKKGEKRKSVDRDEDSAPVPVRPRKESVENDSNGDITKVDKNDSEGRNWYKDFKKTGEQVTTVEESDKLEKNVSETSVKPEEKKPEDTNKKEEKKSGEKFIPSVISAVIPTVIGKTGERTNPDMDYKNRSFGENVIDVMKSLDEEFNAGRSKGGTDQSSRDGGHRGGPHPGAGRYFRSPQNFRGRGNPNFFSPRGPRGRGGFAPRPPQPGDFQPRPSFTPPARGFRGHSPFGGRPRGWRGGRGGRGWW